jgi:hypothetical protein
MLKIPLHSRIPALQQVDISDKVISRFYCIFLGNW